MEFRVSTSVSLLLEALLIELSLSGLVSSSQGMARESSGLDLAPSGVPFLVLERMSLC